MPPTLRQIQDLRESDFAAAPVWVSAYVFDQDEEWHAHVDEATFRPWDGPLPFPELRLSPDVLVSASFTLAGGENLKGFAAPPLPGGGVMANPISSSQPIVFLPGGSQAPFWLPRAPTELALDAFYDAVGRTSDRTFPIRFRIEQQLIGFEFQGIIPGFCYLSDSLKSVRTLR
jgi:hypothetical protein